MRLEYKPSPRFAEYVRKITCDHWETAGVSNNDRAVLRHKATGQTVSYALHDGGNDRNGGRNFAADVQRICGCRLLEVRGRKRSRKAVRPSGFSIGGTHNDPRLSEEIDLLNETHKAQRSEWERLTASPTRPNAERARVLIGEIAETEASLERLHQPVERIVA